MIFGLEQNIFSQPLSLIFSILLLLGSFQAGNIIIERFNLKDIFFGKKFYKFFSILFFLNLIIPFLHFSSLFGIGFKIISSIIGIVIFFSIFSFFLTKKFNQFSFNKSYLPLLFLLSLYFLASLAPITNADSLDYHLGVALHILNYGFYPTQKFWFHSIQSGAGEALLAFGFFFKSEQFGSLVQFSGLITLFGCIKYLIERDKIKNIFLSNIFFTIILSSPIIIQLVTSVKPQLFFTSSIIFIFTRIFYGKILSIRQEKIFLLLVFLLLSNAVLAKFYFILFSSIILIFYSFNKIKDRKNLAFFVYSGIIAFLVLILPTIVWKYLNYQIGFLDFFLSPFPRDINGYDALYKSIVSDGNNLKNLNTSLIKILFPTSIIGFTQSLGIGVFLLIFLRIKNKVDFQILFFSIFSASVILLFGQQNARFLLEPYFFLMILLFVNSNFLNRNSIILSALSIQPLLVCLALLSFIFFISVGSLNDQLRKKVMIESADGYTLSQWSNKIIPKKDVVIYTHRSISFNEFKTLPADFLKYTDIKNKDEIDKNYSILNEIKQYTPKYIIFYGNNFKNSKIFNCTLNLEFYEKNVGKKAIRNVLFRKNFKFYDGYIYKFDSKSFPNCLLPKN